MRRMAVLVLTLALWAPLAPGAGAAVRRTAPTPTTVGRQLALGAFAADGSSSPLAHLERSLGSTVAIASSFRGWGDVFPDAAQLADARTGHTLLVAWDLGATPATRYATFPAHAHDAYLATEAAAARAYGRPLYVRPWAEMNGDWSAYQPTPDGARPAGGTYRQFVAAWRYLVTFFRAHGATNVRWVFNPTTDTYAQTTDVRRIWPGNRYVDVLGLDGYNWGTGGVLRWRSFADIYAVQYRRLVALAPALPVWVCEFASKEPRQADGAARDPAHSKAAWYAGMVRFVATARHISALVLFDVRKERDWLVGSDRGALATMRAMARVAARSPASAARTLQLRRFSLRAGG